MKPRLWLLASVIVAMVLALVGGMKDLGTIHAAIPLPIQPFQPESLNGVDNTQLGQRIDQELTKTQVLAGQRDTAPPWTFSGPGYWIDWDKNVADGTDMGTVFAEVDVNCDGESDFLYDECPNDGTGFPGTALHWLEATTVVQGTPDAFLISAMPPYSWLLRNVVEFDHVCLDRSGVSVSSPSVLNSTYTTVPFSPNGETTVSTTLLGGSPTDPPSTICIDTPDNSESVTPLNNPPLEGNWDRPCDTTAYACADVGIYGMWTDNTVTINGPFPASTSIVVQKRKVNNGPEAGDFREHWDAETTNPNIVPEWLPAGTPALNEDVNLTPNTVGLQEMSLQISCGAQGWGLVILKNILAPIPPTKDTYLDDNAFTFVVKVVCGAAAGPEVDKEVALIKANPDRLPLTTGGAMPVAIDELKENHSTANQAGQEWLVAEAPDVVAPVGPDILLTWVPAVTVEAAGHTPQSPVVSDCTDPEGDACITFAVNEWPGQADVLANLNVQCVPTTPPGLYPVVIKAIDVPTAGVESKAGDNVQRKVLYVWCGGEEPDTIEDADGLYARWTTFQSVGYTMFGVAGDIRKNFKSPPSLPSDTGYVERIVDLDCYWVDADGCDTCDGSAGEAANGYISAEESWNDPDLVALGGIDAVDADRDCLAAPGLAQPGHPVDPVPALTGTSCDANPNWVLYSENPVVIHHDTGADQDCDGLVDGIEKAWGSNPLLADSDSDGSADFVEMFVPSTPVNPDTDGDGYKDRPASVYGDKPGDLTSDNCPAVYNPTQVNSDGHRRPAGTKIPGVTVTSNPLQDKKGDACDNDNDNDNANDGYEIAQGTDPFNLDTDGDTVQDGAELRAAAQSPPDPKGKPLDPTQKPAWSSEWQVYFRGCHINVPTSGPFGKVGGVEMDVDGDGTNCPTDPDSDNGGEWLGVVHPAKVEINDNVEAFGYNTFISNSDSDGDGCEDWIEIHDINGDRKVTVTDQLFLAKRYSGANTGDPVSDRIYDVNKDTRITTSDLLQEAKNTCSQKAWGGCPSCPAEN